MIILELTLAIVIGLIIFNIIVYGYNQMIKLFIKSKAGIKRHYRTKKRKQQRK